MEVCCWNVNGISGNSRFNQTFLLVQHFRYKLVLQKTNILQSGKILLDQWGMEGYSSSKSVIGSGVLIAFEKASPLQFLSYSDIVPGHLLRADFHLNEIPLYCYNIYISRDDLALETIEKPESDLSSLPSTALILLGGDFNCTLDPSNDRANSQEYRRTLQDRFAEFRKL